MPIFKEDVETYFDKSTPEGQMMLQCGASQAMIDEDPIIPGVYERVSSTEFVTLQSTSATNASVLRQTPFARESFKGGPPKIPAVLTQ